MYETLTETSDSPNVNEAGLVVDQLTLFTIKGRQVGIVDITLSVKLGPYRFIGKIKTSLSLLGRR